LNIGLKWKLKSSWNRINFSPDFKIVNTYTETFLNLTFANPFPLKMIAAIWVQTPISNFHKHRPDGYKWALKIGEIVVDSTTFTTRYDEWKKLDFFKGGALVPIYDSYHLVTNEQSVNAKVIIVETNVTTKDLEKYTFQWINSKNKMQNIFS